MHALLNCTAEAKVSAVILTKKIYIVTRPALYHNLPADQQCTQMRSIVARSVYNSRIDRAASSLKNMRQNGEPYLILCQR